MVRPYCRMEFARPDELEAILDANPVAFVPLGFPDEAPQPTARRPVEHIIDWIDDAWPGGHR